jgi:hypothetical protein
LLATIETSDVRASEAEVVSEKGISVARGEGEQRRRDEPRDAPNAGEAVAGAEERLLGRC